MDSILGSNIEDSVSDENPQIPPINEKSGHLQASESPSSVTNPEEDNSKETKMVPVREELKEVLDSLPANSSSEVNQASGSLGLQNSKFVSNSFYESDVDAIECKEETVNEKSEENDRETAIKMAIEKLRGELLEARIDKE